jgi:hypothetical protein
MTNHRDILNLAAQAVGERGHQYGPVEACFDRIIKLFKLMTGRDITMYETAMLMACVKLARMPENPTYDDNYIDGINYLAFAAQFAALGQTDTATDDAVNNIGVEIARRFAPKKPMRTNDFDPLTLVKQNDQHDTPSS